MLAVLCMCTYSQSILPWLPKSALDFILNLNPIMDYKIGSNAFKCSTNILNYFPSLFENMLQTANISLFLLT